MNQHIKDEILIFCFNFIHPILYIEYSKIILKHNKDMVKIESSNKIKSFMISNIKKKFDKKVDKIIK